MKSATIKPFNNIVDRSPSFSGTPRNYGVLKTEGFTLVELLVVIAIIGILAALLLPTLASGKRKTVQTQCGSNMRQVGIALQSWLDDNNDWLPPGGQSKYGLHMGQHPGYQKENAAKKYKFQLVYYLAPYLGNPSPDSQTRVAKVLWCPGFERQAPNITNIAERICFAVTSTNYFKEPNGTPKISLNPFGYPPGMMATPMCRPSKIGVIASQKTLSDVYSLVDVDQIAIPDSQAAGWRGQLPSKPSHGDVRNYLYFDSHVSSHKVGPTGFL